MTSSIAIGAFIIMVGLYLPPAIFSRVKFAWRDLGAAFEPTFSRLARNDASSKGLVYAIALGFGGTILLFLFKNTPGDIIGRLSLEP